MSPLKQYTRSRIVSINGNQIIASVCSTLILAYPIGVLSMMMGTHFMDIVLLSYILDACLDFGIFAVLHSLSHKDQIHRFIPSRALRRDLIRLQVHRIILAIIFFGVATSSHYWLLMQGYAGGKAFVISYLGSLVFTRIIHTLYGLKSGLFEPLSLK